MTAFIKTFSQVIGLSIVLAFISCDKQYFNKDKDTDAFKTEVLEEKAAFTFPTSNFTTQVVNTLEHTYGAQYYTQGKIQYRFDNDVLASIDFGDGSLNPHATLTVGNSVSDLSLTKQNNGSDYTKVIVTPIIKTDDCSYIVQGIIKYYDASSGDLVATIDFGDGTCDEWATKTWPSMNYGSKTWTGGSKTFNMDDWLTK